MKLREFFEAQPQPAGKTIGVCFGRFNPPHKGHRAAWETAAQFDDFFVGTNQNTQGPNDPLPYDVKLVAMQTIWPEVAGHVIPEQNLFALAARVYEQFGESTNLRVATDEDWLTAALVKYNGKEGPHGYFKFASISQEPTPRLSSATALRAAVRQGDREEFSAAAGVPADTPIKMEGKRSVRFFDLVKHYLDQFPAPVKKKKKEVAECAGVGIVNKQNSTADVGPGTLRKNLDAFNLEESHMAELHAEIGEYLDGPISGYKKQLVDADAFGGYCVKLAHVLARKHDIDQDDMQRLINDYVEDALVTHDQLGEAKTRETTKKATRYAMPNMQSYEVLDNNNHPYLAYRFGVALAGSPEFEITPNGPQGSDFTMVDYSDADAEIRKGAERNFGIKSSRRTGKGSEELPNTYVTSPVAKRKKNKYGV